MKNLVSLACVLTSCSGYHLQTTPFFADSSLELAPIAGDQGGLFTLQLSRALASTPQLHYTKSHGRWLVEVHLFKNELEVIGYEYDRKPLSNEIINRLEPNEGRQNVAVTVSVYDTHTQKSLIDKVPVHTLFDFNYSNFDTVSDLSFIDRFGVRQPILKFSLGQLDTRMDAAIIARSLAYADLSKKIVALLTTLGL